MVALLRIAQVLFTLGIMFGVGAMFTYVYDTNHYTNALLTIIFGTITLTLQAAVVVAIQTRIMELKEED